MSQVIFTYEGNTTSIQCDENDKVRDICLKFCTKVNEDLDCLYFLYGGEKLKEELTFKEIINGPDIERNKMNIVVNSTKTTENNSIIKSKEILCPKCGESAILDISNYQI